MRKRECFKVRICRRRKEKRKEKKSLKRVFNAGEREIKYVIEWLQKL